MLYIIRVSNFFLLGVGRLIAEAQVTPIVVPFWHEGKLSLLPIMVKYIFN